jgi:2TM domain-containing protein
VVERHTVEEGVVKPEQARELAIQRLKMKQDFKGLAGGGALAIVVTTIVWVLGEGGYYWPIWVILGVAIALVVQGWKAYGPNNQITEADVQREMERG